MLRRMSSSLRFLSSKMSRNEQCNVVVVGLDNSGKSTMINFLQNKGAEDSQVAPTVGFRVETFKRKNISFTAFDMSGQGKYRNLWEKQYTEIHAIIFVIDSTDHMRMAVVKDELEMILQHDTIQSQRVPIAFLCNKMDCKGAMSAAECVERLDLQSLIRDRAWFIIKTNARNGDGIDEAMDFLADNIESKNSGGGSRSSLESKK